MIKTAKEVGTLKGVYYTFDTAFADGDESNVIETDFTEYVGVTVSGITSGEEVKLQGSINGDEYFDFKDSSGTITFNADGVYNANVAGVRYIKASKTGVAPVNIVLSKYR